MANSNPVLALLVIFTFVWALVLGGAIIVFKVIVPLHIAHAIPDSIVKGVLSAILVIIWLGLFVFMRDVMVRRQLYPKAQEAKTP